MRAQKLGRMAGSLLVFLGFVFAGVTHADDVASLDPLQGLVQHRPAEAAEDAWETVAVRRLVGEGDWIRTNAEGLATATFFEGVEADIWPNTLVQVSQLDLRDETHFVVSVDLTVGEMLSRVEGIAGSGSSYEVHTPNAVVAVRGTEFWVRVLPEGVTEVTVVSGLVSVIGLNPDGEVISEMAVEAGFQVTVSPAGAASPVGEIVTLPEPPPPAPVAPATCGDGICAEREDCPLDCQEFPGCGDAECDLSIGEDVVTCMADCVPSEERFHVEMTSLHFFWGEMRCDIDPAPSRAGVANPIQAHWGIGCFDSAAHASAHPHPADYQLTVDGQAWNMGSLRQSGPHVHSPYCPWGWDFDLGPFRLEPGEHTLTLIETVTDTWEAESGGRTAGEVVQLTCTLVVR
jgi:hypothetical protein